MTDAYSQSVSVFIRGLDNLNAQLQKAEEHAATSGRGESGLLNATLAAEAPAQGRPGALGPDLHHYPLAAHVHWAAEGAKIAVAYLLGAPKAPAPYEPGNFADLRRRLDAAIASLEKAAPGDLEAGLEREVVMENRRGTTRSSGRRFLLAFAIPHFFYHVTTAYGILRNQGVKLTMGDFLGNWVASEA